jgi:hypothetical protein
LPRYLLLLAGLALPTAALAAGPFDYFGSWKIVSSQPAPWMPDAKPVASDVKHLAGKTFTISAKRITAARPVGCPDPVYEIRDWPAEMLFQGTLTDPESQARTLGYAPGTIRTLVTGCEGDVNLHFLDKDTALFALNNFLWRIERVKR